MKLAIKWPVGIIGGIVLAGLGFNAWIAWGMNREAYQMHEGHIIVDEIKAHDSTISVTWGTTDGHPEVVVRGVFEPDKQDTILGWAKAVKNQGRVHRPITLEFHREIPHSHIADTVLRTVEFRSNKSRSSLPLANAMISLNLRNRLSMLSVP
jgi:hypothetical protein